MCQLCDEADAYLAQLEARAKMQAEERKDNRPVHADFPTPKGEGTLGLKKVAPQVRM